MRRIVHYELGEPARVLRLEEGAAPLLASDQVRVRGCLARRSVQATFSASWHDAVAKHWSKLNYGQVHCDTIGDFHTFRAQVYLDELEPDAILVELYAEARDGEPCVRQPMTRCDALVGSVNGFIYTAQVPSSRPAGDYTPRIVPAFRDVHVPLEAKQILWQR